MDYLRIPSANGAPVTIVDVHSPRVVIFQRWTNYHVIKAIHVDVWKSCNCWAKSSIFNTLGAIKKLVPIQNALAKQKKGWLKQTSNFYN